MSKKPSLIVALAALVVLGTSGVAVAGDTTDTTTNAAAKTSSIYRSSPSDAQILNGDVLPVLLRVNKQGKIDYMSPAYTLRSQYQKLLRASLAQMITKPAHDKHGQPIASEFIIYVTGKATARTDGKYDFHFAYVTAKPVPFGNWIWTQYASGKLALMSPYNNAYYNHWYNRWGGRYRPGELRYGACYYEGRNYGKCAIFCAQFGTCVQHKKSDKNAKDDDKTKATGSVIRAASTHVYRLRRPHVAARIQTPRVRANSRYVRTSSRVQRLQPITNQTTPLTRPARMTPIHVNRNSGTHGSRAPTIMSRRADIL